MEVQHPRAKSLKGYSFVVCSLLNCNMLQLVLDMSSDTFSGRLW
jgi:hypothetical protein